MSSKRPHLSAKKNPHPHANPSPPSLNCTLFPTSCDKVFDIRLEAKREWEMETGRFICIGL